MFVGDEEVGAFDEELVEVESERARIWGIRTGGMLKSASGTRMRRNGVAEVPGVVESNGAISSANDDAPVAFGETVEMVSDSR